MQIVSNGDNLHEMSNPVFLKNNKNISKCHLLKILSRMLRVRQTVIMFMIMVVRSETRVVMNCYKVAFAFPM